MHVFPTDPSPTTTHLMSRSVFAILEEEIKNTQIALFNTHHNAFYLMPTMTH